MTSTSPSTPTPAPQPITIRSKRKVLAQGHAIVSEDYVAITKLTKGADDWLQAWGTESRLDSQELTVETANSGKALLTEGFMKLYYWNELKVDPTSSGWERFLAVLRKQRPFTGTLAHRLWRAAQADEPILHIEECYIYSDVPFVGELRNLGPFDIKNNIPCEADTMASLTLRYKVYRSLSDFDYTFRRLLHTHPKYSQYRERILISIAEEVACIVSVATGRRLIGDINVTRWFGTSDDPLGDPRDPGPRPEIQADRHHSMLPYYFLHDRSNIELTESVLRRYFGLPVERAARFLRAAILYKKALIYSDEDADLAWIWSVGAIETLAEVPGDHKGVLGRFTGFLIAHSPPPPAIRPPHPQFQLPWGASLRRAFEQIYAYRSDFLHAGHPFPSPMTHPPENLTQYSGVKCFSERPRGGKGFGPTKYEYDSSPMELHVFLYIVQGCLLNWLNLSSAGEEVTDPIIAESARVEVRIIPTAPDQLRVVAVNEDETIIADDTISKVDLIPLPLVSILPTGYEVSELVMSRMNANSETQNAGNSPSDEVE